MLSLFSFVSLSLSLSLLFTRVFFAFNVRKFEKRKNGQKRALAGERETDNQNRIFFLYIYTSVRSNLY